MLGCGESKQKTEQPNRAARITGKSISETIAENRQRILSIPGVVKIEPGSCILDSCIKVYVVKKNNMMVMQIPSMLGTWRVDIVQARN
jgi:hypothetical protein